MRSIFERHIEVLGEILLTFKVDADEAAQLLEKEKTALEAESHSENELIAAAMYNALASIRTSPEQERPTGQLVAAISDARDELCVIMEDAQSLSRS